MTRIKKPKYTKEELEIIRKYGVESDKEFDTTRLAFTGSKDKRITALYLAQKRKRFLERHGKIPKEDVDEC